MNRIVLVTCVVLVWCASATAAPSPRLFTEDEIKKFETALRGRFTSNKTRTCSRPVLRGATTAGRAAADLLAFEKPAGAIATCLTTLKKLADKMNMYEAVETRHPELKAFDANCGARLEAAVRRAISHEDACSPFQIGSISEPALPLRYIVIAHALGLRIRLVGDSDPTAAIWLALDVARFGQDLGRGSGAISHSVGSAISEIALESARVVLDGRKLQRADLDAVGGAVDKLLASTPSAGDVLASELDYFLLYYALAALQPTGWVPPGGWPADMERPEKPDPKAAVHPRDVAALLLLAGESIAAKVGSACPTSGSLMTCHAALQKLVDAKIGGMYTAQTLATELIKKGITDPAIVADQARLKVRASAAEILASGLLARYPDLVARSAGSTARLTAVQLHINVLKTIDRSGKCPPPAELRSMPQAAKELGDSITVAIGGDRSITASMPKWTSTKRDPYAIKCP